MESLYMYTHAAAAVPSHAVDYHSSLSEAGRDQAHKRAENLQYIPHIFSSSYRSAVETTYLSAAVGGGTWSVLKQHTPLLPGKPVDYPEKLWKKNVAIFLKSGRMSEVSEELFPEIKQQMKTSVEATLKDTFWKDAALIAPSLQLAAYASYFTSENTYELWERIEEGEVLKLNMLTGQLEYGNCIEAE